MARHCRRFYHRFTAGTGSALHPAGVLAAPAMLHALSNTAWQQKNTTFPGWWLNHVHELKHVLQHTYIDIYIYNYIYICPLVIKHGNGKSWKIHHV